MFNYNICINNGVEAFGTEGKTITVNEVVQTADIKALAREIHHENMLIPEQVAESVLQNFAKAAANLMAQGFAIQFKSGDDVLMRIYPDIHIKGGNINLARAKAECESKFTELLLAQGASVERKGVVEKAYVARKENQGGNQGGGTNPQNPNDNGELG